MDEEFMKQLMAELIDADAAVSAVAVGAVVTITARPAGTAQDREQARGGAVVTLTGSGFSAGAAVAFSSRTSGPTAASRALAAMSGRCAASSLRKVPAWKANIPPFQA